MCKPCRNAAFSPKKANYDRIGSVFARYGAFPRQTPTKCRKIGHRKFKFEFVNNILICSFPDSHAAPPARAGDSCGRSGRPQPGGAQSGLLVPQEPGQARFVSGRPVRRRLRFYTCAYSASKSRRALLGTAAGMHTVFRSFFRVSPCSHSRSRSSPRGHVRSRSRHRSRSRSRTRSPTPQNASQRS